MSGLFLTEKQVGCYALVDLFGLQADTIANKFLTEKKEAPNPIWEHEPFIFNKVSTLLKAFIQLSLIFVMDLLLDSRNMLP